MRSDSEENVEFVVGGILAADSINRSTFKSDQQK